MPSISENIFTLEDSNSKILRYIRWSHYTWSYGMVFIPTTSTTYSCPSTCVLWRSRQEDVSLVRTGFFEARKLAVNGQLVFSAAHYFERYYDRFKYYIRTQFVQRRAVEPFGSKPHKKALPLFVAKCSPVSCRSNFFPKKTFERFLSSYPIIQAFTRLLEGMFLKAIRAIRLYYPCRSYNDWKIGFGRVRKSRIRANLGKYQPSLSLGLDRLKKNYVRVAWLCRESGERLHLLCTISSRCFQKTSSWTEISSRGALFKRTAGSKGIIL